MEYEGGNETERRVEYGDELVDGLIDQSDWIIWKRKLETRTDET